MFKQLLSAQAKRLNLPEKKSVFSIGIPPFYTKYEDALEYHRQALVLIPQNASTYSAIGYIHSLMGNFESAIDYFHTALGLRRDDTFSVTMLGHCIEMNRDQGQVKML
ncbi:hypothetical protein AB205_0032370 [Aquarana catesbeiana]|uniref:Uncharacterized protein n=1 Tax=Aquarana catesbeiana TaxID=8400 RepID=A0A2G9S7M9_AQUCT|nr:hypothetical protein AB205_0032370 [Aquarana catesbeiana]